MNKQTTMKHFSLLLAVVLMASTAMAQRSVAEKPVSTKPQTAQESPTKPAKDQSASPMQGDEEPAEDLSTLNTADQCRAYAEKKARYVDEQVGGLDPAQRKKVYDIFNKAYLDIRDMRQANTGTPKSELKERAIERLNVAKTDAIAALTPEQQESLAAWRDGRSEASNSGKKDQAMKRAEEQTRNLHNTVNLTEAQRKQVLDLNTQLWKEGSAWRSNNPEASSEDKKAYAKEMQRKRMDGYRSILTQEQQDAYKASLKGSGSDR